MYESDGWGICEKCLRLAIEKEGLCYSMGLNGME
jgi:hypothetical protein